MAMIRDVKLGKAYTSVIIKIFGPDGKCSKRISRPAKGCVYTEDTVDKILEATADVIEKLFPGVEFRMVQVGASAYNFIPEKIHVSTTSGVVEMPADRETPSLLATAETAHTSENEEGTSTGEGEPVQVSPDDSGEGVGAGLPSASCEAVTVQCGCGYHGCPDNKPEV